MSIYMVFDAKDFLDAVSGVKKFWLHTKLNRLRIEAHKDSKRADLVSVNKDSGLETVVSIPANVGEDFVIYVKTVISFYESVELLRDVNVGKGNSLFLRLSPSNENKRHFDLQVLVPRCEFTASEKPID